VNGTTLTQAAVGAMLQASKQQDTPQSRQALKQLIARMFIQQAAEKANYGKTAMQVAKTNAETQSYLQDHVKPEPVTHAQVKSRYDEIVASLGQNEYKPRLIVVKEAETAATVLRELKAGQSFDSVARQYSLVPNREVDGEQPWVSFMTPASEGKTFGLPLVIAQVLEKLPVGAVAPEPIPLADAWAIVKLDARRPIYVPPFDQAQAAIRQQLEMRAREKAIAACIEGRSKHATIQQ
ncbi:peptidylprolyl isomerase, partial [Burkholderia pyrrocinia]|uniref:peptidylprolyl isomerase n=1 Tax=Burkholderia pyrrocinia TaxID=60550 RepID=UPI001FC7DE95